MNEKICPNCGTKTTNKFCSNCGQDMSKVKETEIEKVTTEAVKPTTSTKAKSEKTKNILIIALAVIVVVLVAAMIINMSSLPGIIADEETGEVEEDIALTQNQGKTLPGGKYTVGEDISAGKYFLEYKTNLSEDDYWSNDYFWVLRSGSKGANETLGGTKYDDRVGAVDFEEAKKGKTFFLNLKDGDVVTVDSNNGDWTY